MAEGREENEGGLNAESGTVSPPVRHTRRLSDKLLVAFHQACDLGDYEVAESLVRILETMVTRRSLHPDNNRRRNIESLVAAHERLWHLRHPSRAA